uniref:SAM-dependent MTase RsmB/NOP-type domain-containing protein n=1 Tax=Aegilops tauschii TaxID=37682 RepID=N1QTQ4_AEGTA
MSQLSNKKSVMMHMHMKVMGILKLADEMGLSCIRAYKLDALKSVRKAYEERNLGVADNCSEAIVTLAENSGPIRSIIGAGVTNAAEDSSTAIVEQTDAKRYVSKADLRKNLRRLRNGTGRSNCSGGRVEDSKGFFPSSFDRVLLDAPCSALGLRPRLFAGEVRDYYT